MNYKNSKWATNILKLQHDNGSWGCFHSLSNPNPKQPITTEQALKRLKILGYTKEDKPIKKVMNYIENCLSGKEKIPDRVEKLHNWKIFTELMFSTWIKIYSIENKLSNVIINKWSTIINRSFESGQYNNTTYISVYEEEFGIKPREGRLTDFVSFYQISLLSNKLDKNIEPLFFKYVLEHDQGIYYVYGSKLLSIPKVFKSKYTSSYISAIELLAEYNYVECKKQLDFVVKWLKENMIGENKWDMGKESKDGINFPLSDSWRKAEDRIKDCTYRIEKLINKIEKENRNIA